MAEKSRKCELQQKHERSTVPFGNFDECTRNNQIRTKESASKNLEINQYKVSLCPNTHVTSRTMISVIDLS